MLKSYGWVAQPAICMAQPAIWWWHSRLYAWHSRLYGGVVAHEILVSAPVPFGFRSYWDLVGVGPRESWD